ncbi:response regulator transcription factor [Aquabacterium sp. CECT 9606]|uniref:response regulator n=1 Tax=Aquabacterium sp. CECT 9606 TaxID=2845822 RepID=UPI001E3F9D53|nr:response regulator transcription factor [Aquabacterium sp. CECT 9606]CAH0354361.1 Transcriptional regulatory protein DegU [Aquabacterium sp. CECT 9606]
MRVLIIDDHPLFREGLQSLLLSLDAHNHVVQAARVADACKHPTDGFDLILLDLNLPGQSRLDALREVRQWFESASVVIISADDELDTIHACIQAGASGFIPKDTDSDVTIEALRIVLAQGIYLPPKAVTSPPPSRDTSSEPGATKPLPTVTFSDRQLAVLRSLLQGKSNKVIARDIGIAEGTVKAHLWAVYQTLGVSSRAQAMYKAHELGLLRQLDTLQRPAPRKKREW